MLDLLEHEVGHAPDRGRHVRRLLGGRAVVEVGRKWQSGRNATQVKPVGRFDDERQSGGVALIEESAQARGRLFGHAVH